MSNQWTLRSCPGILLPYLFISAMFYHDWVSQEIGLKWHEWLVTMYPHWWPRLLISRAWELIESYGEQPVNHTYRSDTDHSNRRNTSINYLAQFPRELITGRYVTIVRDALLEWRASLTRHYKRFVFMTTLNSWIKGINDDVSQETGHYLGLDPWVGRRGLSCRGGVLVGNCRCLAIRSL